MKFSAQQIAAVLGGALYGNANVKVSDVAPIEQAQAQHLTFITDEKYLPYLQDTKAGVVLITRSIVEGKIAFPDGEGIRLPPNLTLLATMNTSDQNVYTLDNAFQRRWDMRLVSNKLDENSDQYKSPIEGLDCSWGKFRDEVNKIIVSSSASTGLSSLEDKRLGGWFVEADDSGEIAKDTFAYKVLKYLWDDALKMDRPSLFKNGLERTLEDVIEDYKDNNLGPAIFIDSFIEALTAK